MASAYQERSWDGIGRIHRFRGPRNNKVPVLESVSLSVRQPVPHVSEIQMAEGVELPIRYDRSHLEVTNRLVRVTGEEKPLPIREVVLRSLQQPVWQDFFGRILHQSGHVVEAPLQKPA